MRNTKKAISILLTLLMVVGMMSTFAFADTRTITITNAVKGEVYYAYKIFDATFSNVDVNGQLTNESKGSYTIRTTDAFYNDITSEAGKALFTLSDKPISNGAYIVTINSGVTTDAITDFFKNVKEGKSTTYRSQPAISGTTTISGLPDGYYFVSTAIGTVLTLTNAANVSIVDKNDRNPGGETDGKSIVTVNNKGKEILIDKTSVEVGDEVNFRLKLTTSDYKTVNGTTERINSYTLSDILPQGMQLASVPEVSIDEKLESSATVKSYDGKDVGGVLNSTNLASAKGFQVYVPWTNNDGGKHIITVNYKVVITEANSKITNRAEFEANDSTIKEPTAEVYTYKFSINKYKNSVAEGNELAGAKFKIYTTETGGVAMKFKYDEATNTYTVTKDEDGSEEIDMSTKTSVIIAGVKNGTYYLEETQAPSGCNALTERQSVIINNGDKENSNVQVENVINNEGSLLPSTGGIGTTIFYLIGAILVIGAGVVFVTRRRMHSDK